MYLSIGNGAMLFLLNNNISFLARLENHVFYLAQLKNNILPKVSLFSGNTITFA